MKKLALFLAKSTISLALLWYLFSKTDFSEVLASLQSAHPLWLLLAFSLLYVGKVLTGYRWQVLLEKQGIDIPLRTLIASIFVGQFFNTFLPTTVGGDAIRAYDTAAYSKESTKSITALLLDRLIGVLALALLAVLGVLVGFWIGEDVSFFIWPALGVFLVCLVGFVVIFNRTLAEVLERIILRFGFTKIAKRVREAYLALDLVKHDLRLLSITFAVSIALQINVVLFYYFIALAIDIPVALLYYFIIVPVALILLLVPFSINGIGLREGIFVFLLTGLAVPSQDSIALSLLAFALILTQGILGGIIFALRGVDIKELRANPPT
jgi:uncharacterized protein (TIRG00374 family)